MTVNRLHLVNCTKRLKTICALILFQGWAFILNLLQGLTAEDHKRYPHCARVKNKYVLVIPARA